jgi:hypothetical protein
MDITGVILVIGIFLALSLCLAYDFLLTREMSPEELKEYAGEYAAPLSIPRKWIWE